MGDADRGVELHALAGLGRCVHCGLDRFATLDEEPTVGSVVFCGGCASLTTLQAFDDGRPHLATPNAAERLELLKRPDVQRVRDAYQLDQMEARMTRSSQKHKRPSAPRTGSKVRIGQNRLEARGPDAG